jgi:hypothetical protein
MGIKNGLHLLTPLRGILKAKTQNVTFASGKFLLTKLNFSLWDTTNSDLFPLEG